MKNWESALKFPHNLKLTGSHIWLTGELLKSRTQNLDGSVVFAYFQASMLRRGFEFRPKNWGQNKNQFFLYTLQVVNEYARSHIDYQ